MSDDTNACLELPQQPHGLAQEKYGTQSVQRFPHSLQGLIGSAFYYVPTTYLLGWPLFSSI